MGRVLSWGVSVSPSASKLPPPYQGFPKLEVLIPLEVLIIKGFLLFGGLSWGPLVFVSSHIKAQRCICM